MFGSLSLFCVCRRGRECCQTVTEFNRKLSPGLDPEFLQEVEKYRPNVPLLCVIK